jgi:hypothetical protein
LHRLGPITCRVWLATTFTDPDKTRLAIWAYIAQASEFIGDRLSVLANLPRNARYQDLAKLVADYARKRFGNAVVEGLTVDDRPVAAAHLRLEAQNV